MQTDALRIPRVVTGIDGTLVLGVCCIAIFNAGWHSSENSQNSYKLGAPMSSSSLNIYPLRNSLSIVYHAGNCSTIICIILRDSTLHGVRKVRSLFIKFSLITSNQVAVEMFYITAIRKLEIKVLNFVMI